MLSPSMSDTSSFYACGSNLHQQLQAHVEDEGPLAVSHLQPFQPSRLPIKQLLTVTTSQVLYTVPEGNDELIRCTGFDNGILLQEASMAHRWLGRDHVRAFLSNEGYVRSPKKDRQMSASVFLDAAMDSHGHILAISSDSIVQLYQNLEDLSVGKYAKIPLATGLHLSRAKIYAGASHFLVMVPETNSDEKTTIIFGLGDNRHFQQGHKHPSSWIAARKVEFFDESMSAVVKIACGDLHTAFLTADGALYMAGNDTYGQCGGFSDQEPSLVEWQVDGKNDADVDVHDVACGSSHTVAVTSKGVFVAGRRQLGAELDADLHEFVKIQLPSKGNMIASRVFAAGWNTLIELHSDS